uniref:Uncharacterized protein n=1 Tax=Branchiostoma floridae TaxID=7739 RepID=C3YHT1_BRAFL|eukprot:XP_002604057.1 hypothetical protein BRAFLDRAFT_119780 [Branchiostoma floridae]
MATGAVTTALSYDNALLATLAVYGSLLVLKFLFVSAVTNWRGCVPAHVPVPAGGPVLRADVTGSGNGDTADPGVRRRQSGGHAVNYAQVVMVTLENFKELKYIYQLRDLVMKQLK